MADVWREKAVVEIRQLVHDRNRFAKAIETELVTSNAVHIPKLSSNEIVKSIVSPRDYENQKSALLAFLSSPMEVEKRGNMIIPTPLLNEISIRVSLNNLRVEEEADYAKEIGKVAKIGGVETPSITMGNARIFNRKLSEREPEEYRGRYDYSKFVERVFNETATSKNSKAWEKYKQNYIKGIRKGRIGIEGTDATIKEKKELRKSYNKALKMLKETDVNKFKDAFYSDLEGDIDFLSRYKDGDIGIFSSRIETVANIFGMNLYSD